jgi:two-component system CheB/CheR fusion protein
VARQLEDELMRVKTQLQTTNHQHELQAEALKASNEELQAMNEELRSAAEELETSKEELQSINEELTTVNQELKVKIDEVSLSSDNLRNLINSTDIATLFLDRSLRVNLFTPITQKIFNLIPADYGRPLTDITHHLDYHQLAEDAQLVLTSLQPQEREVATTDGRVYILRILPYRTAQERINGIVLTLVDITRRKAAEAALKESDRRKDEFLALLAHELRNPMSTLSNALQVLEMTGGTDEQLPLKEVLPLMSREVQYLVRLVDDLLDISRINLGKIELHRRRLELTQLVGQVQEAILPLVEQAHQHLRVQLPSEMLYVEGDAVRLMQVLRNLIGNAIKFSSPEGVIDLYLEHVGPEARLRVKDTGIGIAKADLPKIFTLFAQVDASHTRLQSGLGLGLTLVWEIITSHGGRVEAHSAGLGQGSEFVIYLPLVEA